MLDAAFMVAGRFMRSAGLYWVMAVAISAGLAAAAPAGADTPEFTLVIESHRFIPAELKVPAGQKIRLLVENRDPTAEEFESYDFNREKVVPGKGRIVLFVGPLKRGRYEFFGEFNSDTARGFLVAE
jgi:plastocyanin